jgi:hypothetical protein
MLYGLGPQAYSVSELTPETTNPFIELSRTQTEDRSSTKPVPARTEKWGNTSMLRSYLTKLIRNGDAMTLRGINSGTDESSK